MCIGVNSRQVGQLVVTKIGDGGAGARESVQLCKPGGDVPTSYTRAPRAAVWPPSWQNFAMGAGGIKLRTAKGKTRVSLNSLETGREKYV